jgi:UDP-N-acetylglucosamine diphosphorylase / glucose-1-phosphate thymidylyltransferase / UDP-N-acetylgalactosamine diphosphorylase / glucosamine-1-phosphate N-acetyltransferase / galactosamine-1-phosphate N-acetyltransferase
MLTVRSFFDLNDMPHAELFPLEAPVWQPLHGLKAFMDGRDYPQLNRTLVGDGIPLPGHVILHDGRMLPATEAQITYGDATRGKLEIRVDGRLLQGASLLMAGATLVGDHIDIGRGVLVESGAMIKSPTILGDFCEVRQGAYLRGYCLAAKRCVLGHATEIKHSIFLNDAKAGHFAYLGDSILGGDTNLGAGTKLANLRFLPGTITIFHGGERVDTNLRKFGAILGDTCQTGCNSVTSPGTLMAKGSILMPNATAKSGYHQEKAVLR